MNGMKWCSRCKETKAVELFYTEKSGSPTADCKECRKAKVSKWYYSGKQDVVKNNNLRFKYGMTLEEFKGMEKVHGGLCAVCRKPDRRRALHVDHDHATGIVRGLLCSDCNNGLGAFRDNSALMRAAADYIEGKNQIASDAVKELTLRRGDLTGQIEAWLEDLCR